MEVLFNFEEIHCKALLKILNFVNQEFLSSRPRPPVRTGAKGRPPTKSLAKSTPIHPNIETIDGNNSQLILDSILNCCQYFDKYFKYNYKFAVPKAEDKISRIEKWLQNYYKKDILDKIDFNVVLQEVVKDVSEVVETNANGDNVNTTVDELSLVSDLQQEIKNEIPTPELSLTPDTDLNAETLNLDLNPIVTETETQSQTQAIDEELNAKIVYNLELILLLIVIIVYKVRNLFPKLLDYLDFAWIYLSAFETEVEPHLEIENLVELLQNEFSSERNANRMRTEVLSNEIIQLNSMIDNLDKQYEDETKELIYLQNATIIGHTSAGARQLSKLLSMKAGQSRDQKIYPCPECGKNFKNAYKLNRHRYVHKDPSEKPYVCDWPGCGYRSIANNDLNRHRMIHTGEKPFQCDVDGCERKYSRPDKLSHHKKVAHNTDPVLKPFACDWPGCGYRAIANADLTRHQYIHTGERPFKCDYTGCDKSFSRPDKLRNHKDKVGHNLEELNPLSTLTSVPTMPEMVRPLISIAECLPQAMQWT